MQFRQLEYLVALARERHFARAAAASFVSQPALSDAIRRLERELGVTLVERDQAFQSLTPAGVHVVEWAQRVLAEQQSLHDELGAMRSQLAGTLRLGVVPTAVTYTPRLTVPFTDAHPLVSVDIHANLTADEIVEQIAAFELDAGITYIDGLARGLTAMPLYRERYAVAMDQTAIDPAWREDGIPPEMLGNLRLVMLSRRNWSRKFLDIELFRVGVVAAPRIETDSVAALFAHASTGEYAAVISTTWIESLPLPNATGVVPLRVEVAPTIGLIARQGEPGSMIGDAFFNVARTGQPRRQ